MGAWVRKRVRKHDEHVLMEPFAEDFRGREEPDVYEVLECPPVPSRCLPLW